MRAFFGRLTVLIAVWSLAACSDSSGPSSGEKPLTVTATIGSDAVSTVKANGSNVVTINVAGASKAPIAVISERGTFSGGSSRTTIDGLSGSVDLTTCDARTDSTCAENVKVTAVDAKANMGSVTLKFIGYETICDDGQDNNGDGTIDCADSDCDLKACALSGTAGTCQSLVCVLPVCTPGPAEICNNLIDDDCDHQIDCAELSCDGKNCKDPTQFPTWICKSNTCTDVSSGWGLTVVPKRTRLPADGLATTSITVTLTSQGTPQPNAGLTLTTDRGAFLVGGTPVYPSTPLTTDSNGTATVIFQASPTAGTATVTAALTTVPLVNLSTLITMPVLGSIQIGSIQYNLMGVKYSGWQEQNQISVLLLDTEQKPYPDGLDVQFEHQQRSGSTISIPSTNGVTGTCDQNSPITCHGKTSSPADAPDTKGLAYVNLYSGTTFGLTSIKVTAAAGGVSRDYTIQNIAIVGAKANSAQLSLYCSPLNIPALSRVHTCVSTSYAGTENPIHCTAHFADRFGNVLGRSILATFNSEAGAAGPPVFTAQYDPTKIGDQTNTLGFAVETIAVNGYGLPADVKPLDGEPSVEYTDECGTLTHNPRDGLVTIIVMAKGEEGFVDLNGNGVWDKDWDGNGHAEPFIDQGEPFVDANDNGQHDPGEFFLDTNNNGVYDGPNGTWDADTTIWAETRVLYTGLPYSWDYFYPTDVPLPHTNPVPVISGAKTLVGFIFEDQNLNPLAPAVTSYAVTPELANCASAVVNSQTVDRLGMVFTQQYCDQPPGTSPTICSNTCPTSPCYMVSSIGGYDEGSYGRISITGSTAGNDTVDVDPTVDGIHTQLTLQIPVSVE